MNVRSYDNDHHHDDEKEDDDGAERVAAKLPSELVHCGSRRARSPSLDRHVYVVRHVKLKASPLLSFAFYLLLRFFEPTTLTLSRSSPPSPLEVRPRCSKFTRLEPTRSRRVASMASSRVMEPTESGTEAVFRYASRNRHGDTQEPWTAGSAASL